MKKLLGILACALLPVFAGTAQAMLVDRGMVGSGADSAHLIFDTDRNITWADVNSGSKTWDDAMNWAATGTWGGFNDWRLPTALNLDHSGPCFDFNCTGSEMGHLFYTELGGLAANPISGVHNSNFNLFSNLHDSLYWSGTEKAAPFPGIASDSAWDFGFHVGDQDTDHKFNGFFALPVRAGDVGAPSTVPLPGAVWLFGSALAGLAGLSRRGKTAALAV